MRRDELDRKVMARCFATGLLWWGGSVKMDRWNRLILGLVVCAAGMCFVADALWL